MAGSIIIDLLMRTGSFETDTKRAEKRLRAFKKEAQQIGRALGTALTAGAAAVAGMTVQTVRAAEEITRLSALANVGADDFQRYAAGANLLGIEQDKLADIFKDTQDKVGDFLQTGGGPLADFFENIAPQVGVTAEQFRKLSGPEALELFVQSLERANLSQSEMVFFMEAIASDATLLLPLLRDNAAGFRSIGDAAADAGAIMGEDLLQNSAELAAATQLLQFRYQGMRNELVEELVPTLADLSGSLFGATTNMAFAEDASDLLAGSLRVIAATAVGAVAAFQLAGRALGTYAAALKAADLNIVDALIPARAAFKIGSNIDDIQAALSTGGDDLQKTALEYGEILSGIWDAGADDAENGAQSTIDRMADVIRQAEEMRAALADMQQGGGNRRDRPIVEEIDTDDLPGRRGLLGEMFDPSGADQLLEDLDATIEGFVAAGRAVDGTRTQVERLEEEIASVRDLIEGGFLTDAQGDEVLERLQERLDALKEPANAFLEDLAADTRRTISDALVNGVDEGLGGLIDGFQAALTRMAADAVAADIAGLIFGEEGPDSGGGLIGAAGEFFGNFFGGGRAGGGPAAAGARYRVNEIEPEFFVPATSGKIVPLSDMPGRGRGGGDVNVQQTINVSGRPDQRTASQIAIETARRQRTAQARLG